MSNGEVAEVKEKAKQVDLNDLQLADEQVDLNPDADAFAGPPPPDDGDHLVKLSLGKGGVTTGTISKGESKGKPWYQIEIVGKIQSPDPFEGRLTFNRAGTMVFNGTSEVVGVLKAIRETVSPRETVVGLLRRLNDRLVSEPTCVQKTQWTAYCADCLEEFKSTNGQRGKKNGIVLRGQNRFPQENGGKHRHQIECPNCGTLVSARADVVAYRPAPPEA
jgi:hypothetical protein